MGADRLRIGRRDDVGRRCRKGGHTAEVEELSKDESCECANDEE
jgi:hypothetical protein